MERIHVKVRKVLWLTLSAEAGHELGAYSLLYNNLARERQNFHVRKVLGMSGNASICKGERHHDGEVVCSMRLKWAAKATLDQCLEVCDWLAPVAFQAGKTRSLSALHEALTKK